MGLFDSLKKAEAPTHRGVVFSPMNEQEAWIAILYLALKSDNGEESDFTGVLQRLLAKTNFQNHDLLAYFKSAITTYGHNAAIRKQMILDCVPLIQDVNKQLVFLMAVETTLEDSVLLEEEQNTLELLKDALQLEDEVAKKIIDVYLIRSQYNIKVFKNNV